MSQNKKSSFETVSLLTGSKSILRPTILNVRNNTIDVAYFSHYVLLKRIQRISIKYEHLALVGIHEKYAAFAHCNFIFL
jgi:hypothetical protein